MNHVLSSVHPHRCTRRCYQRQYAGSPLRTLESDPLVSLLSALVTCLLWLFEPVEVPSRFIERFPSRRLEFSLSLVGIEGSLVVFELACLDDGIHLIVLHPPERTHCFRRNRLPLLMAYLFEGFGASINSHYLCSCLCLDSLLIHKCLHRHRLVLMICSQIDSPLILTRTRFHCYLAIGVPKQVL